MPSIGKHLFSPVNLVTSCNYPINFCSPWNEKTYFYSPWNREKTIDFQTISGRKEVGSLLISGGIEVIWFTLMRIMSKASLEDKPLVDYYLRCLFKNRCFRIHFTKKLSSFSNIFAQSLYQFLASWSKVEHFIFSYQPLRKKFPYSELFWSECGKIRTRITPNTDTFHAVNISDLAPIWSFSGFRDGQSTFCVRSCK